MADQPAQDCLETGAKIYVCIVRCLDGDDDDQTYIEIVA